MTNKLFYIFIAIIFLASTVSAQTTSFTFQGKLNDGAVAANGTYQFQFKLYDAATGGNQVGQTIADLPATVANGIFAVNLDFGAASYNGAARFIEVGVRLNGGGQPYTILNPRQAVASTPYSVKSLKSDEATTAVTANNSLNLGGIAASEYVQTTDTRMSDARNPLPNSPNYIQNGTGLQTTSNFNISGEGKAVVLNATTQYNLNGVRILSGSLSNGNFIAGFEAGMNNTSSGDASTFVGVRAGKQNTNGAFNSFFGYQSGLNNTTGGFNTFLGAFAGGSNTTENENTFIGYGANGAAGITNATAIGTFATVTTSNTMVLGTNAVTVQVPGSLNVAGTFSANILNSATVYKINNNRVFHLTGADNTFVGFESGNSITSGNINAFFGKEAGKNTTTGFNNSFFGAYAGRGATTSTNNAFFGANAGLTTNANFNAFFGANAGFTNTNGTGNSFFGNASGINNESGQNNTFIGTNAGAKITTGSNNTFIGAMSGTGQFMNPTGSNNTAIGYNTRFFNNPTNATVIGANVSTDLSNSIVLGNSDVTVYASKLSINGDGFTAGFTNNQFRVDIQGITNVNSIIASGTSKFEGYLESPSLVLTQMASGGNNNLCWKPYGLVPKEIATCSSSIRYKENVQNFTRGLELLNQLRPVTFNWKADGMADVGFVAEEVNRAEPLLSTFNDKGEIEGVKYAQITTVLVNSVKEQQTQINQLQEQIKRQQEQIEALKILVCTNNPTAAICQPNK